VRYLALAHNQRIGSSAQANVLLNLGREDRLDPDGLRRLVRLINRYLGGPDASEPQGCCPSFFTPRAASPRRGVFVATHRFCGSADEMGEQVDPAAAQDLVRG